MTTEITNPFDPNKDYFAELKDSEKWSDKKSNNEYPYLKGLKRLAFTHRGGIKEMLSNVVKVPCVDTDGTGNPDCIAAVTVTYHFNDGTTFQGSADASFKAHEAPFNLHLVATAESKAAARAIRNALNINQVAKEEIGDKSVVEEDRSNEPITDVQVEGIKKIAKRKQLGQKDVLKLIKREDAESIDSLTTAEGIQALKAVNKYKPKKTVEAAD